MHTNPHPTQKPAHVLTPPASASASLYFHPLGTLLLHSLPQALLLGLWGWMLLAYKSYLAVPAQPYFYTAFAGIVVLWLGNGGYALVCLLKKQRLSRLWIGISLPVYVLGLAVYYFNREQFISLGVPNWQQPVDILHYTGSFIVPALLHQLSLLALWMHHRRQTGGAWRTLLMALLPPALCYLMIVMIVSLRLPVAFEDYWLTLLVTCATVVSVFYMILGGIKLGNRRVHKETRTGLMLLLTSILPLVCLLINNGTLFGRASGDMGIFGDFNHPLFYVLALGNGLAISLPVTKPAVRKWMFLLRCMLLPFSIYFFLVIAPYMPFSIFLVFAFGLGLLLLTPIAVVGFHLKVLRQDVQILRQQYTPATLAIAGAIACMALPTGIYLTYQHDRVVLHQALDYLENPTATTAEVSDYSLRRTIRHVQGNKEQKGLWIESYHTPLLSPWFTWQVLDGLSLSDTKVNKIKQVYLGEPLQEDEKIPVFWGRPANGAVGITSLTGNSRFDAAAGHWVSEVALELHNPTSGWQEYITRFALPAGSFVSDYYLYIGDRREAGLLVEKKAAVWVYDQITSQRRDPGLLRYLDNGSLELRVYPFVGNERRRTGFTLLHKRSFVLQLDDQQLALGDPAAAPLPQPTRQGAGLYLPKEAKQQLPLVTRRGYWHILIDVSKGKEALPASYGRALQQLLTQYPELAQNAKISFVNHSVSTYAVASIDLNKRWQQQEFSGGFYLQRALQSLYAAHATRGERDYPIPLIVTDAYDKAILPATLLPLAFALPQTEQLYQLTKGGSLQAYSLAYPQQQQEALLPPPLRLQVRAWPNAENTLRYLPDTDEDEVVPLPLQATTPAQPDNSWERGLQLWGDWQTAQLHPHPQAWQEQVRASFAAHVLSPHTAFMVVEEAWQKDMLMRKQEQFLNGHPGLDSELQEMPEPEFWLLLALFLAWLGWRKRRQVLKAGI